ncbi:hypothetical protein [Reinekea sp.]|jgi:hypothetical protein|uniref:hypothetical protein n=1 Tax=Reinekea sp. TaxID=1970455 RepID=UPI003988A4E0
MTTEIWSPASNDESVPANALKSALEIIQAETFPKKPPAEVKVLQSWMSRPYSLWGDALSSFDIEQLNYLVRFFTLAEATWSDWFGGDKNPAIWASKELKKQQAFPDKAFIEWIRANTDNRFIPYGNVLG